MARRVVVTLQEIIVTLGVLVLLHTAGSCRETKDSGKQPGPSNANKERAIAEVNGRTITEGDLLEALLARQGKLLLRQMIDEVLVAQRAQSLKIVASLKEVDEELRRFKSQFGSEAGFRDFLKKSGQNNDQIRRGIRLTVLIRKISRAEAKVTEKEMLDYYRGNPREFVKPESVHLRDLLLDSKENAEELRKVLQVGGEFGGLAKAFSLDPATKKAGGDMGILPVETLAAHLAAVVKTMKVGEISAPIEAPDGWYLLKLEKRIPAAPEPFNEAKKHIEAKLVEKRSGEIQSRLLPRLRKQAAIKILEHSFQRGKT